MGFNLAVVFGFILVSGVALLVFLLVGWLVRPRKPDPAKGATYECAEVPFGSAWFNFNNRFYIFALIFVIFDVEVVFLFPWAVAFGQLGLFALIEMVLFVLILFYGLFYAWKKGALKWV